MIELAKATLLRAFAAIDALDLVAAERKIELVLVLRVDKDMEWREVAMADAQLAEVPWTHIWYPEALELRVNWRIRINNAKERKRFADEAILMIDRLAIMSPTLNLYALRAHAGLAAQRPEVAVESLSNYARLALAMKRAGISNTPVARKDVNALIAALDEVAKLPGVDAVRIAEVRAEIGSIAAS